MPDSNALWPPILINTVLTFVAALGVFQVIALRNSLEGLSWMVGAQRKRLGYLLAGLLMAIAFAGGILLLPQGLSPPALLSVAAVLVGSGLAWLASILGAEMRLSWDQRRRQPPQRLGKLVEVGPLEATLYQPVTGKGPFPAVCLLPDPTAPGDDLTPLIQALAKSEIAVLVLDWQALDNLDRLTLQGMVAVGFSHLQRWPEANAERAGLLGVGLGGDLALRSAAMDSDVAAVLAIEPVLSNRRPGLGLESLRGLSWFGAQRRARRWRQSALVGELDAPTAIPSIVPRLVAIVVGCAGEPNVVDNLEILRTAEGCSLVPAAHTEAVRYATEWLTEHLA
jgi:hypothetical protein